jgi:predicted TIM-barrel fold metal-dependent hydrolase
MTLIIDADSHITEPHDVWTSRVPSRYIGDVPHVVSDEQGKEIWILDDVEIESVGFSAPAGFPGFPPSFPQTLAACHPAAYDAEARLQYLDEAGIWAQVLYPNVAGFGSQRFLLMSDEKIRLLCVQAFNDFLHEWVAADTRRLLPIISLPFWDVEASVREIERCVGVGGFKGILFTGEPQRFGLPLFGDPHWDPLFSCAQAAGLPVHLHIGGGRDLPNAQDKGLTDRMALRGWPARSTYAAVDLFLKNAVQCTDLVTSGVLSAFPDLAFVSVESGMGWAPFVLDAMDFMWLGAMNRQRRRSEDLLPSELFRRQVYVTTWFEKRAPIAFIDEIPTDNVLFETDFPHISCLYGDIEETIAAGLGHASDEVRHKILWANAARLYGVEAPDRVPAPSGVG